VKKRAEQACGNDAAIIRQLQRHGKKIEASHLAYGPTRRR
jgi:hypothetical protein